MSKFEIDLIDPKEMNEKDLNQYIELRYIDFAQHRDPLPPIPRKLIRKLLLVKPPSYQKSHQYTAKLDEIPVAFAYWVESFEETNTNRSAIYIFVTPERRLCGFGKRLLKHILTEIPEKIDTITILHKSKINNETSSTEGLDDKLRELGGKIAYTSLKSASDITQFDAKQVTDMAVKLKDRATKKGYRLVLVKNGHVRNNPNFDFDNYLQMRERIFNDMPAEDLTIEQEVFTPEDSDEWYRSLLDEGFAIYTYFAIEEESGKLAGLSELHFHPDEPTLGIQDDTGVLNEYRGNRLGLTLKYQLLDLLKNSEEMSDVKWWVTGNATTNEHMLRINKQLGYKPISRLKIYEFDKMKFLRNLHLV